jgi:hypothetical protein
MGRGSQAPWEVRRGWALRHRGAGNLEEELFTSGAAIDAARQGQPIPSGTVTTLVDYRDGGLFRYVGMEKRTSWGAQYPPEKRNGNGSSRPLMPTRL